MKIKIKSKTDVITNSSSEAFILRSGSHAPGYIYDQFFRTPINEFIASRGFKGKEKDFKVYHATKNSQPYEYGNGVIGWREGDVIIQISESSGLMWDLQALLQKLTEEHKLKRYNIFWTEEPIFVKEGNTL